MRATKSCLTGNLGINKKVGFRPLHESANYLTSVARFGANGKMGLRTERTEDLGDLGV